MIRHYRVLATTVLAALAAACSSGDGANIEQSNARIAGGAPATEYGEAVRLSSPTGMFCSGTLIAPRVVLTAGHCVRLPVSWDVTAPYAGGQRAHVINSATLYPGNNPDGSDNLNANDVGLMALDVPISVATYAVPSRVAIANNSAVVNVGTSQAGQSQTDPLRGPPIAVTTSSNETFYSANGQIIQPGDSGGPTYIPNTHIVVAVNAAAGGNFEALSRVDLVVPWIYQQMQAWGLPYAAPAVQTAFQANTGSLWADGNLGAANFGLGMMPGTSPSVTALAGGGYQIAFQANTGSLWTAGSLGTRDLQAGMMAGTSPSITALPDGGYEIAFQANTGSLWTTGTTGSQDWQMGMMAGTSPSIGFVPQKGVIVAFQANTRQLWLVGPGADYPGSTYEPMAPGTSPSVSATLDGNYVVAINYGAGSLATLQVARGTYYPDGHTEFTGGFRNWGLGLMAGTSPSVTGLQTGGFQVAFQANTGSLWTVGDAGSQDLGAGMMRISSPAILPVFTGGYEIAFQANTGSLWMLGATANGDMQLGMAGGTSPVRIER